MDGDVGAGISVFCVYHVCDVVSVCNVCSEGVEVWGNDQEIGEYICRNDLDAWTVFDY